MIPNWLRRKPAAAARRMAPQAEWLEPRLLYSADAGALLTAAIDPQAVQTRALAAGYEYASEATAAPTGDQVRAAYALTPLQFEEDRGQLGDGVDFAATGLGYSVRLGGGQAELLLAGADDAVRLELAGAGSGTAEGENLLATRSNSLVGQDASQWATDIANYGSVLYRGVYDGIDVRYYGNQSQLEYDFLLAAGADASKLQLRFHGTDTTRIDANGDLVLTVAGTDREIRFQAPVSYQEGAEGREAVESHYALEADGTVRIVVGAYDKSRALVVDPVLLHATYFGEAGADTALGVAVGADGFVYVTGQTTSTTGTFATRAGGGADTNDIYVAKFSADLGTLVYVTRVGGTNTEQGNAIAVDANGNAVVTGWTRSGDFVGASGGSQGSRAGTQDAVLFKLNAAGNAVVFSTYFGSTGATDVGTAVAVDAAGNVYAAGTISPNQIILDPILGPLLGGSDNAFLNKYDASGVAQFQVQFGGSGDDGATGLALDAAGNIYMVGNTASANIGVVGGPQASRPGGADAFLAKFDGGGTVRWSTYIGGNAADSATGVAVDGSGRAYVIGRTDKPSNSGFLTTAGAFDATTVTHQTGYLRIYDTTKTGAGSLQYSTFVGGTHNAAGNTAPGLNDNPIGVAVSNGRVVIVGTTDTANFPVTGDAVAGTNPGPGSSGFLLLLNPQGNGAGDLLYGTYYGTGLAINAVTWSGSDVYLAGSAGPGSGLATPDGFKPLPGGGGEGLLALFAGLGNTAPVLAGANALPAQLEDATAGGGTLVSDLLAGQLTDADAGALGGIAVTVADSTNGTWQYTLDGVTWNTLATPANGSALLLAADGQTRVRFVASPEFSGSSSITFRAWDRAWGTAGTVATINATGGIGAYSSATATATVAVTPVNDMPVHSGSIAPVTATEGGPAAAVGLAGISWAPGGGSDEAGQVLTYTITALPTGVATITLANGTAVVVGNNYTLAEIQGLRYQPIAPGTGTGTLVVRDSGGTANGGQDTLVESLTITVLNVAPTLSGANAMTTQVEDTPAAGTLVSDLVNGRIGDPGGRYGIAVTGLATANGTWEYTRDGGATWTSFGAVSDSNARLLEADTLTRVRFVPAANWNGTIPGAITFRAWDRSSGTAGGTADTGTNGDATAFSTQAASSSLVVTAVNDMPVRTGGTVANMSVAEGTAATSLGLGTVAYGPGGGADEAAQALTYTVTAVPSSLGRVVLADGTTTVTAGTTYTLAQVQGMRFAAATGVSGTATFSYTVRDSGGTPGADTLAESLTVQVTNRAPVLNRANALFNVDEDLDVSGGTPQGNPPPNSQAGQRLGTSIADLILGQVVDASGAQSGIAITGTTGGGTWQYTLDRNTWIDVNASASSSVLLPPTARLRFVPAHDWNGAATVTFRAWDQTTGTVGGTADTRVNGGTSAFSGETATASLQVTPINDAPVLVTGTLPTVSVAEGTPSVSLGLSGVAYGPGGGTAEAAQTLTFRVGAIPAAAFGSLVLADGSAVRVGVSYTWAQMQGMQFRPAAGAAAGTATFAFDVVDNGGTANGGVDTLAQSLTLGIVNAAPVLTGANPVGTVLEDSGAGAGTLVADLVNGRITDPGLAYGIAVTAVDESHGKWQYSPDGGSNWSSLTGVGAGSARLLAADGQTRVRFVADADWNGTAGIVFAAWDRSSGTAGGLGDARTGGGASAFSSDTATSTITVSAQNDKPVRTGTAVADLTVAEDSGSTSLGLGAIAYGPGGGADEATQVLTYTVTTLPPASLGRIVLADGTVVTAGVYSLGDLQGMRFEAAADAHGSGTFAFRVQDNGGGTDDTLEQALTITVTPEKDAPVAQDGAATLDEGGTVTGAVQASDADLPGDTLTITLVTGPAHGDLVLGADGSYTYTHDGSENFVDAFTYRVTDADGLSNEATVRFTIRPVNDHAPVAQGGSNAVDEGGTAAGSLVVTDDDTPDTLTFSVASGPTHGTVTINTDGTYSYTHDGRENFSDAFTYEVADAAGHKSQATITLTITPLNDNVPAAQGGSNVVDEGGTVAGSLMATDDDTPDTLTFSVASGPTHGAVTINADGTYSYTHDGSENFGDSFTYEVTDAAGHKSQATVTLTVTPVNDNVPVAQDAGNVVDEGATVAGVLVATDDDSPDTLTFAVVTGPTHGSVTINGDGTYSYTHNGSENFADAFTYEVTDAAGHKSQATITLTITPVNDNVPAAQDGSDMVDEGGTVTGSLIATDDDRPDTLTFAVATGPTHGTLSINTDGTYSYTHNGSENFADAFTYEVTDAAGHKSQATVTLAITPVNDNVPAAQGGSNDVAEGGTVVGSLVATDDDTPETLTFSVATGPTHGTVTINTDGTYSYTHDGSENFADAFTYEVTDAAGHKSQATVTLTITPVNDNVPVAQGGSNVVDEGGTVTGSLVATDPDTPDTLTFSVATGPTHGTVTINADGTYSYTHDGSENFGDAFAYEVTDAAGHKSQATITLTIAPVNDNAPIAQAGTNVVDEGGTIGGSLLVTDDDTPETLTFSVATGPTHGTVTINADGTYSYTHNGSENFADAFTYEVTDAAGHKSQATITLTITPVNDNVPVAQGGSNVVDEGGSVTGSLIGADDDRPDTLTFSVATGPTHGTVTINADGSYSYTHNGSENFADAFTYEVTDAAGHKSQATITLTITPVNDNLPVAQGGSNTVDEGGSVTGSLIATDDDTPETLTFSVATGPTHGTVTINGDGTYSYSHDGSENFADAFTYEVTDAAGHKSKATVTLAIAPVNDNVPAAQGGSNVVDEGGTVAGALVATDDDNPDTLTFSVAAGPTHGTVTISAGGTYSYTHNGSENFTDAFTYEVTDAAGHKSQATITLTIASVNDNAPAAQGGSNAVAEGGTVVGSLVATDDDTPETLTFSVAAGPTHGTVTINTDGTYSYTHNGSENFNDAFTYEVTDAAGHKSQATITLAISPVNDNVPAAQSGSNVVDEAGTVTGLLTATDADTPDTLTFSVATGPTHGTVTIDADGAYSYKHDGSENFADAFTYEVTDAAGHKSQATVTLAITPVNDNMPVAQGGSNLVDEGGTVSGSLVATDDDVPDTLIFSVATAPTHGTVTVNADGTYSYTHNGSENFADAFTYEVTDAAGHKSQATITLTITPVNDNVPVAQGGSNVVDEGGTVTGSLVATDPDAPDTLTFSVATGPTHGAVTINTDGTYSYTHDGSENFGDAFAYEVTDAAGHKSQATITLTIAPVNDNAPIAQAGTNVADEGSTVTGSLVATDDDSPDTLTFTVANGPAHGTVTINTDGTYSYTHDGSENFSDAFAYEVTDAAGHKSQATVTLTIAPVNDNVPLAQGGSNVVDEGGTVVGSLVATDDDTPETLTFSVATGPTHGTVTINADGTYSYTHNGSENFTDAFTYEVTDAAGHKSQATITLTVTPVNDNAPVAQGGSNDVDEGSTVTGSLIATDDDRPETLAFSVATGPTHGTITINTDGTYSYTHDGSENFSDSFTYEVTDAAGHKSQATVTLTVTPVNDNDPAAQGGSNVVDEGGTVTGSLTATDADTPDTLTFSVATGPTHGTVTINTDGTYSYTHNGSENFADAFTYEVTDAAGHKSQAAITLTITPVNDNVPVAQGGSNVVDEGGTVTGSLVATDPDTPGTPDTLTFSVATGPTHGTITINTDGTYSYTHDGSENFGDAFAYEVTDAAGHKSQATITLTIAPVNDNLPVAQGGSNAVDEGGSVTGSLIATDDDTPETLTFSVATGPTHGTVTINADGTYSYTHDGSENFADAFTYEVTDAAGHKSQATVTLAITPVNDNAPAAQGGSNVVDEGGTVAGSLIATDVDRPDALTFSAATGPTHGSVTISADGTYTYTHDGSETSGDSFTFRVTDAAGASSVATVTLVIAPVDDPSILRPDTASAPEETAVTGNVLANDEDVDTALQVTSFTIGGMTYAAGTTAAIGSVGTFTLAADGSFRFVPATDWAGAAPTVTYTANSGASSTLNVAITPINDAPVRTSAPPADVTVIEGSAARPLGFDSVTYTPGGGADEAAQALTVTVTGLPVDIGRIVLADGRTEVTEGGVYTLQQLQGMQFIASSEVTSGTGRLAFTVADGEGGTLAERIAISVVNQAPTLAGANALPAVAEDTTDGAGMLVRDLIAGQAGDPLGHYGIAVVGAQSGAGTWEFTRDGGANWRTFDGVSGADAELLLADADTRIRFVPNPDWNGDAGGLVFRAWDFSDGLDHKRGDTTVHGGSSAFSSEVATATAHVWAVNDAPRQIGTGASGLVVTAGTPSDPLLVESVQYAPGGGADEAAQVLTVTVTTMPPPQAGTLVLADGSTPVVAGASYSLEDFRGVRFVPATSAAGSVVEVGWLVRDDGGTQGGGSDFTRGSVRIEVAAAPAPATDPDTDLAPAPTPAPAPVPGNVQPAPAPTAPPTVPAPAPAPARSGDAADAPLVAGEQARTEIPVATALLSPSSGFAPQRLQYTQDTGRVSLIAADGRDLQGSTLILGAGEFAVTGFTSGDVGMNRITVEQFQQTLRSGAFVDELNRLRKQLHDEFDIDRTTSITVAGLSLGVSVVYVLWLIRGGVLLGSYLSALPAWRLLDPLPVLARTGDEDEEEDEAFAPSDDRAPDPLRGFA